MPLLTQPVRLPRAILLYLWELEGLGEVPPVLGARELYIPLDTTGDFTRQTFRVLGDLGLARDEVLTREFRVALRVLASPVRELYCWSAGGTSAGRRKFAVALAGGEAVAVQVRGDMVAVVSGDERRFVEDFLSELPECAVASVPELHVSRAEFEQRDERHDMFATRERPEKQLEKLMKAPRDGAHQVYVGGMNEGRYQRSKPFTVVDIRDQGRVLTFTDGGGDIHCLPGSSANLTKTFEATWQSM